MWIVFLAFMAAVAGIVWQLGFENFISTESNQSYTISRNCKCPPALINETELNSLKNKLGQKEKSLQQERENKKLLQQQLKTTQRELDLVNRFLNFSGIHLEKEEEHWRKRESLLEALLNEKDNVLKAKDEEREMAQKYFDHLAQAIIQHAPQEDEEKCEGFICAIIDTARSYWTRRSSQGKSESD